MPHKARFTAIGQLVAPWYTAFLSARHMSSTSYVSATKIHTCSFIFAQGSESWRINPIWRQEIRALVLNKGQNVLGNIASSKTWHRNGNIHTQPERTLGKPKPYKNAWNLCITETLYEKVSVRPHVGPPNGSGWYLSTLRVVQRI
jgi:hypothetical protein